MRLELTTSAVTGRRSNQLNYQAILPIAVESFCFPSGDYVIILHSVEKVNPFFRKNSTLFILINLFPF